MSKIFSPFTSAQVESLNGFQQNEMMHSFTCGGCRSVLVAEQKGWVCPDCPYTQDWAHDFMADGSWRKLVNEISNLRKCAK